MTKMLGAICGDILGSSYEFNNIKHCPTIEEISLRNNSFTDDTVMTCAVAKGISAALNILPKDWISDANAEKTICNKIQESMVLFGQEYPDAGYGLNFYNWLMHEKRRQPYNSWGNGSAMRVSYGRLDWQKFSGNNRIGQIFGTGIS